MCATTFVSNPRIPGWWSDDLSLALQMVRDMTEEDPARAHYAIAVVVSLLGAKKKRWDDDLEFDARRVNYLTRTEPVQSAFQAHIDATRDNNENWGFNMRVFGLFAQLQETKNVEIALKEAIWDLPRAIDQWAEWITLATQELKSLSTSLLLTSKQNNGTSSSRAEINDDPSHSALGSVMSVLGAWCGRLQLPGSLEGAMVVFSGLSSLLPASLCHLFIAKAVEEFSTHCPRDFTDDTGAGAKRVLGFLELLKHRASIHQVFPLAPAEEAAIWRFVGSEFKGQPAVQQAADHIMSTLSTHRLPLQSKIQEANLAALYALRYASSTAHLGISSTDDESTLAAKHVRRMIRRAASSLTYPGAIHLTSRDLSMISSMVLNADYGPSVADVLPTITRSLRNVVKVGSIVPVPPLSQVEREGGGRPLKVPFLGDAHSGRFGQLLLQGANGANFLTADTFVMHYASRSELRADHINGTLIAGGAFNTSQECEEWVKSVLSRFADGDYAVKGVDRMGHFVTALAGIDLNANSSTNIPFIASLVSGVNKYFDEWCKLVSGSTRSQNNASNLPLTLLIGVLAAICKHRTDAIIAAKQTLAGDAQAQSIAQSDIRFEMLWAQVLPSFLAVLRTLCNNVNISKEAFSGAIEIHSPLISLVTYDEAEDELIMPLLDDLVELLKETATNPQNGLSVDVRVVQRYLYVLNMFLPTFTSRPSLEPIMDAFFSRVFPIPVLSALFSDPGVRHLTEQLAFIFKGFVKVVDNSQIPYSQRLPFAPTRWRQRQFSSLRKGVMPSSDFLRNYLLEWMRTTSDLQSMALTYGSVESSPGGEINESMKHALRLTAFVASTLATSRSLLSYHLSDTVLPWLVQSMRWTPHFDARDSVECFQYNFGRHAQTPCCVPS